MSLKFPLTATLRYHSLVQSSINHSHARFSQQLPTLQRSLHFTSSPAFSSSSSSSQPLHQPANPSYQYQPIRLVHVGTHSHEDAHHTHGMGDADFTAHPPDHPWQKYGGTVLGSMMWFWVFINWWENWDVMFGLRHAFHHRGEPEDEAEEATQHPTSPTSPN